MAKKLSDQMVKRMKTVGISAKTEEEARKKLLAFLEKQGIEGMEEEDTDSLIEMAESFGDEDEVVNEAEQEAEDLADEAEDEEEDEDEEASEETADDDSDEEDDDEEPEEEEEKPKKTATAKKTKAEVKKAEKKPAAKKQNSTRGVKINPKVNAEDRKVFKVFHELFPTDKYNYCWVSNCGVNIKNKGTNANRSLVLLENFISKEVGGKDVITCNLYFSILNNKEDILNDKGIEFENCWNGTPFIKNITVEDAIETIKDVYEAITGLVSKADKKLGENRKKMEESLKKSEKKEQPKEKKADAKKKAKK